MGRQRVSRLAFAQAPFSHLMDLGYPVPKYMTLPECEAIVARFLPAAERGVWERQAGAAAPRAKL